MDRITGYIERITFRNEENGFTVLKLQERGKRDLTCVVGTLPTVQVGESICCHGEWKRDLAYGLQFAAKSCQVEKPGDVGAIAKYLGSGLIKGIGPKQAERIVAHFGADTLGVIDETPQRLLEVPGIGKKRLKQIHSCWKEQEAVREVMVFLQSHEISPTYAQKIYRAYGGEAIQRIQANPYCLARDIRGIGFKRADQIAESLGIAKDSPKRLDAASEYLLNELSSDGHVCYPLDEFKALAKEQIEIGEELIDQSLARLHKESRIAVEDMDWEGAPRTFVWIRPLYLCEKGIAKQLLRLKEADSKLRDIDTERALDWVQESLRMKLAKEQKAAVAGASRDKVHIITGGPGTGKSTITKAILAITGKLSQKILLAAPTGRAAKRMAEICRREAKTLHSLLEVDFQSGGFKRNRDNPLEGDLIIIDEASMIDTSLMYSFLKAVPDHARLILVGDVNQLPSVGPGNVLRDLIDSEQIPVTTLTQIFRQGKGSRISLNAHRINRGIFPETHPDPDGDFFLVEKQDAEEVLETVVDLVKRRLPKRYGFNPIEEIQVLAPMRRGIIGIENLNHLLQQTLNPQDRSVTRAGTKFCAHDKVMQLRNNYKKEVFNGDVGRIQSIDHDEQELLVDFDGKDVVYEFSELDEITLAYAVSIHKYQGSECPCVVMPIHTSHFKMLHRNLLYTGVTRGKKLVVLVGTKKAIFIALNNDEVKRRYTGLRQSLLAPVQLF